MPLVDPLRLAPLLGLWAGRFDVDALAECDSTSSEVLRRAEAGAPAGLVVVADRQTAGRGRRGRVWHAEPEDALTFSLLWRIEGPPAGLAGLSLAVGLALVQALERLGFHALGLKWPNDVLGLCSGGWAKLAGVLVELSSGPRGTQVVIGIGINLRAPRATLDQAVAGLADLGPVPDRHAVLAALLASLGEVLAHFARQGFAPLRSAWEARHAWAGQKVRVSIDAGRELTGNCVGVDLDGSLLLSCPEGLRRVVAGDVSLRALSGGASE